MAEQKIRYGILSTASIVPRFVKGMRMTDNGEVTAIASRTLEKAEQTAAKQQIPKAYDDYKKILADPEIDAVYIPVINSLHYEYAKESLLAGKHVVVEKPFVLHSAEAEELFRIAEERGLFLTEAIKTPHLPLYHRLGEMIESGEYAQVRFMLFRQSYTSGPYVVGWNRKKKSGGGVLYGNEAYFFRMAEFLGGKIVSCSGTAAFPEGEAEDQCSVSVLLENGALANLAVSTRVLFDNGLTIYMEKAVIEVPDYWKASKAIVHTPSGAQMTVQRPCDWEFHFELDHYNACISEGRWCSPVNTPDMTIRYIRLCEQLYDSFDR